MSAPVIWIIFPLVVSAIMLGMLSRPKLVRTAGLIISAILSLFALFQPIGNVLKLGPISIDILPKMLFFGRALLLENSDRFALCLIFITLTLFIGGVGVSRQPTKFIPLSIAVSAFLTAALAVQPFLYSAVFVELAVLLMIPLVTIHGKELEKGIIRFLIYLSMAVPFILFAGWILSGVQASPSDIIWQSVAALFLGVGFALWLGIFPFHSWMPQFSQAVNPYAASFIFSLLPIVTLIVMLDYTSSLVWLRESGYLSLGIRTVGIIMIAASGVWAAVEDDLRRILAFTVLYETGFALLLVSLETSESISLLYQLFFPRIMAIALLGLALAFFVQFTQRTKISELKGSFKKYPVVVLSILISLFSIAGLPLFAGFPVKFETLRMMGVNYQGVLPWILLGVIGLLIAVVRFFASTTNPENGGKLEVHESATQIVFLGIGSIILLLIGLFPQIVHSLINGLLINLPILK